MISRKKDLFKSIKSFIEVSTIAINEKGDRYLDFYEELFQKIIESDRECYINSLKKDYEALRKQIKSKNKQKQSLQQKYALTINKIHMENQDLRKGIREMAKKIEDTHVFKKRKKQFEEIRQTLSFWIDQFLDTFQTIKEGQKFLQDLIIAQRAEFCAQSSNKIVVLRHTKQHLQYTYSTVMEKTEYVMNKEVLQMKDKITQKMRNYKNKNVELLQKMDEIKYILGNKYDNPKLFVYDIRKKTFENQIAKKIPPKEMNVQSIVQLLKMECDVCLAEKDNEIRLNIQENERKEFQLREKVRLAAFNFESKPPSPVYVKHHLKDASWEESTRLFNITFAEIQSLRQSRQISEKNSYLFD
ncbi:hypothetical protein TRFO_33224 [Tritrichomonas foetus]|uniref:Uncharacterized protein n=1 Tax=Tritrichomonas foetus TaxID=1144522 RepID=A0A1J4JM63_9EUKA|nr:hypothetical protein TRFO_33224 [Tritrichomonas foetus]|eukprot:OHT00155.1 hypothetical protein TRFO_33224 [Tritrichomonas foetus]